MYKFYMELIIYLRWNLVKIIRKFFKDLEKKERKLNYLVIKIKLKEKKILKDEEFLFMV